MAPHFPPPSVIQPPGPHKHTVILCHGRGSSGPEFIADLFDDAEDSGPRGSLSYRDDVCNRLPNWRWVFPSAPHSYSTAFQEEHASWFDCYSLTDPAARPELQKPGLRGAVAHLVELARDEAKQLPGADGHLVLAGMSQGGATAIHALLAECCSRRQAPPMTAFVGFCTWLPFAAEVRGVAESSVEGESEAAATAGGAVRVLGGLHAMYTSVIGLDIDKAQNDDAQSMQALKDVPVFLEHCRDDDLIDINLGRNMQDALNAIGMNVTLKEYDKGGHWIQDPDGWDDFVKFLRSLG